MDPREGPEVPFDRGTIQGLRQRADSDRSEGGDPYDRVPYFINWLWYDRMLTTLEECQQLREQVKKLEAKS